MNLMMLLRPTSIPQGKVQLPWGATSKFFPVNQGKTICTPSNLHSWSKSHISGVCCGELLFWHHTLKLADVGSPVSWKLLCWNMHQRRVGYCFSSNPHKSSQVDEQTKVLLKEDSWQMKVYSWAVFPQVQQHWHLFVDTGWKGKMCA